MDLAWRDPLHFFQYRWGTRYPCLLLLRFLCVGTDFLHHSGKIAGELLVVLIARETAAEAG